MTRRPAPQEKKVERPIEPNPIKSDTEFKNALNAVLGYYGTQLQSHAATLLGFTIAILTAFTLHPSNVWLKFGLAFISSILLTLAAFSVLRLIVYGGLSRSILYGNFSAVYEYAKTAGFSWEDALPQTQVSHYAHQDFNDNWRNSFHWFVFPGAAIFTKKDQPTRTILLLIWMLSFGASTIFTFLS